MSTYTSASINTTREIAIPHLSLAATPYAKGGGDEYTIPTGYFKGRKVGRGTRDEIYGSARYGSGYGHYTKTDNDRWKYEPETSLNVIGRDFHFGFPPISWGNYSGSFEYFSVNSTDLPGVDFGPPRSYPYDVPSQQAAILARKDDQTWDIVADAATINILWDVLRLPEQQGGCSLDRGSFRVNTIPAYNVSAPGEQGPIAITQMDVMTPPHLLYLRPWNVIQYYRGSSVFLATSSYDNEYAHPGNNDTDYWRATALNTTRVDLAFLNCLNTTIASSVPIIDPNFVRSPPVPSHKLSSYQTSLIAKVVIIVGVILLCIVVSLYLRKRRLRNQERLASQGDTPMRPIS